ncbi:MAG: ribosome maturation factor RimM [Gemmatimonadota bacterium]
MDPSGASAPRFLTVGHLSKVHGIRGELYVWSLTDHPDDVFVPGAAFRVGDERGRPVDVPVSQLLMNEVRPYRRGYLVRFDGVEDRTAAEFLVGHDLLLPVEQVQDLDEGEFFYHELLGAPVETVSGTAVGSVREVYELAPAHMLEVSRPGREPLLVPLSRPIVHAVERDPVRIVIDPPEGFLDL